MKAIIIFLVAVGIGLTAVSCKKSNDFILVDVVENQGDNIVDVNGVIMRPGQKMEFPHTDTYVLKAIGEFKININGAIYYESGVYQNDLRRKSYE